MSIQSNNQGRACEYAFINILFEEINKVRPVQIKENSAFIASQHAWTSVSEEFKNLLKTSALATVYTIFDMEPLILENNNDILSLIIQTDSHGIEGDVRDIVISRENLQWEIGLSIKHNHFAVKHSRIGENLDFGKKWFGIPCSKNYWNSIKPIFNYLENQKILNKNWNELTNKADDVYVPILKAFIEEIKQSNNLDNSVPKKMVEYLLGEFDFYKVISIDRKNLTQIQTYNLHGTLNKPTIKNKPKISIPIVKLPTRIVNIDLKPNSKNTVELYLDNGWQFSFRIHNASTKVEASLKFDIQIIGMPTTIISIDCRWK